MEEKESSDSGGGLVVAIALSGGSKSKALMKWSIEKFVPEGKVHFKLLHVFPKITGVPTPMGNLIPLQQVRDDVATAYKKEVEWQKMEMIVPYQKLCTSRKVPADIILLESDEIPNALSEEISKIGAKEVVIGVSSNGLFSRKVKGQMLSSLISECAPGFCTIYVVSKGKLESLRPSDEPNGNPLDDTTSASGDSADTSSRYSSSTLGFLLKDTTALPMSESQVTSYSKSAHTMPIHRVGSNYIKTFDSTDPGSSSSEYYFPSPSRNMKRLEPAQSAKPAFIEKMRESSDLTHWRSMDLRDSKDALSFVAGNSLMSGTMISQASSTTAYTMGSGSFVSEYASTLSSSTTQSSSETPTKIDMELERLKLELRHVRGMYAMAQTETMDASRKLSDLSKLRLEEAINLKEINEEAVKAQESAKLEMDNAKVARREAEYARDLAIREGYQRKEAEMLASRAAKDKEKLKHAFAAPIRQYQKFAWEDIEAGCSSFSEDLKIGMGAYGTVYKCRLHHTTAAVKILHSKEDSQSKQFQQELEVLSRIRHPHLLSLLGACPEKGCLVYEYMENGSLEDMLFRKNNTPAIKWYDRFRIAWEVASALAFLHNTKPKPIIHRDLKPANILLDQNLVSKIGDAGLCTMLNVDASSITMASRTLYKDTSPVGTLCYIDPEYQRTGQISTKADVYALGMVILQLLTAKPAVGIAHIVEDALDEGNLMELMDQDAGNWPVRETTEMAMLAIQCSELRRKDRPDLKDKALPVLERLKEFADQARDIATNGPVAPPSHFLCPILKDVMDDPCVAADGYTYDRKAIEMWLKENDTSPTTDFPLSNMDLLPNYTLHYAIMEWKTRRKSPRNSLRSI